MFAPDVQGPMAERTLELIKGANPQVLMIGGPPFYLSDFKISENQLRLGLKNLESLVETVPLTILEHHALRDESWLERIRKVQKKAEKKGNKIVTAAEYVGKDNVFLEAKRKQLYSDYPPSQEFDKWRRQALTKEMVTKPPL
jgi:predicted metallo-beta-lactamase superfamily hydrolase